MSESKFSQLDSVIMPTDEQLSTAGREFLNAVRAALARYQTLDYESDNIWEFEIEGHGALTDQDGFTRHYLMSIVPADYASLPGARSLLLMSTRGRDEGGARQEVGDIYRISFYKNSEQVAALDKAVISGDMVRQHKQEADEELEELLRNAIDDPDSVDSFFKILEKPANRFREELLMQLSFGACNQQETADLIELLQRARPTDPIDMLTRYGQY